MNRAQELKMVITINFFIKTYFSFATVLFLYELFETVLDDDSSCRGLLNLIKKDSSFEPVYMDCDRGLIKAPLRSSYSSSLEMRGRVYLLASHL